MTTPDSPDMPAHPQDTPARVETPEPAERFLAMEFTASGGEYFRIWFVNIALSILTLGIYSAWAKVRTKRYFYGNTRLEGSAFAYHAKPLMILRGRLISFGVLAIYVLLETFYPVGGMIFYGVIILLLPWVVWKSLQFNARMSSYRNVRFTFRGRPGKVYLFLLVLPAALLAVLAVPVVLAILWYGPDQPSTDTGAIAGFITALIMLPIGLLLWAPIAKMWAEYYLNHHHFGQEHFAARLSFKRYFIIYFQMMIFVAVMLAVAAGVFMLSTYIGARISVVDEWITNSIWAGVTLFMLVMVVTSIWARAYLQTRLRNYIYGRVILAPSIALSSYLEVGRLFRIYLGNTLLLICTLGFAYPWTRVRVARYLVDGVGVRFTGDDLGAFFSELDAKQSALGEELGEAFDFDTGIGV